MKRPLFCVRIFSLFFLLIVLVSCSSTQDDLQGVWKLSLQDGYEKWRISGDTVFINEGMLFERRAKLNTDDNGDCFVTTIEGIFKVPTEGIANQKIELEAQPGTSTPYAFVLTPFEAEEGDDNYFLSVNIEHQRPAMNSAKPIATSEFAHFFVGAPKEMPEGFTQEAFSLQLGRDNPSARLVDVPLYLAGVKARAGGDANKVVSLLSIDQYMPMESVYDIIDEHRRMGYFRVVYMSELGHFGRNPHGIERNLFLYSPVEELKFSNPDLDLKAFKLLANRRLDFYDKLFLNDHIYDVHIDSTNRTWVNGVQIESENLSAYFETILTSLAVDEIKPFFIVHAEATTDYGVYIQALDAVELATNRVRDSFCKKAFGGPYNEVLTTRSDANEVRRLVLTKIPRKDHRGEYHRV